MKKIAVSELGIEGGLLRWNLRILYLDAELLFYKGQFVHLRGKEMYYRNRFIHIFHPAEAIKFPFIKTQNHYDHPASCFIVSIGSIITLFLLPTPHEIPP